MNNFRVLTIFTILTVYLSQPTQQAAHTHAKKVQFSIKFSLKVEVELQQFQFNLNYIVSLHAMSKLEYLLIHRWFILERWTRRGEGGGRRLQPPGQAPRRGRGARRGLRPRGDHRQQEGGRGVWRPQPWGGQAEAEDPAHQDGQGQRPVRGQVSWIIYWNCSGLYCINRYG